MKKILLILVFLTLGLTLMGCNFNNVIVEFEDANLETAVRAYLDNEEGDITSRQLRTITEFAPVGANIVSLEGMQYFTRLEILDLEDNFIDDVSPLSKISTLEWLSLRNNEIISLEDIQFETLANLSNLTYLSLRHNVLRFGMDGQQRLSDISILSEFNTLTNLELRDNQITDITALETLTRLTTLDISQNPLTDHSLSRLESLTNLTHLNVRETNATDLSVLKTHTNLVYLNIHTNTNLENLDFLSNLTALETLIAQNVPFNENITVLEDLTRLTRLNMQNTGISDLTVIKNLMDSGALLDDEVRGIKAEVNLSANPLHDSPLGYTLIETFWPHITYRVPYHLPSDTSTHPLINEFMASNGSSIRDVDGDNEDWVELYNPANQAVNIGGYYLSDDTEDPLMWAFPDNTLIPAHGHIIVFASGKNTVMANGEIHTSFRIDRTGEPLLLTAKDQATTLDYVPAVEVPRNYSYGRLSDGGEHWGYFDLPNTTPGYTNNNAIPTSLDSGSVPLDYTNNTESFERLFNDEDYKTLTIQISEKEWQSYNEEVEAYALKYNGELRTGYYAKANLLYTDSSGSLSVSNIGVRTRGNLSRVRLENDDGSLNMSHLKISFHEDFDQPAYRYNNVRTVFEIEEIDMKWNRNYDSTYLTEKYSLDLMRDFGVHAAHTTLAHVYIEIGEARHFYGVYTLFEPIDSHFLNRRFMGQESEGDLYKSLWQQFGPADLTLSSSQNAIGIKDTALNYRPTYDLKTNKSSFNPEALKAFIYNINTLEGAAFDHYISTNFDVDRFLRYLAVGVVLGNPDDYRAMGNNYYLYQEPLSKRFTVIPYDYDHGLAQGWDGGPVFSNWTVGADIYTWGNLNAHLEGKPDIPNPLSAKILSIERYQDQYEIYLETLINSENSYFNFNEFKALFNAQAALYGSLEKAMMHQDFNLRNTEWYFSAKTADVQAQLAHYKTHPYQRP